MTDEEGKELSAQVLILKGWRWFAIPLRGEKGWDTSQRRIGLYPPAEEGFVRWNFPTELAADVHETAEDYERFSDWDRCGSKHDEIGMPRYDKDPKYILELHDELLRKYKSVHIEFHEEEENPYWAIIWALDDKGIMASGSGKTLGEALCLLYIDTEAGKKE